MNNKTQQSETFVKAYIGGHLNKWFSHYSEAKEEQKKTGGYLLPYKNQFFICDENFITSLGFNPKDENWNAIAFDWVKPSNQQAWQRLNEQWQLIQKSQ
jgi:hypothetical protein